MNSGSGFMYGPNSRTSNLQAILLLVWDAEAVKAQAGPVVPPQGEFPPCPYEQGAGVRQC